MKMRGGLLVKRKNVFKPFDDDELQPDRPTVKITNVGKKLVRITPLVQQDVLSRRTDRLPTLRHLA